LAIILYKFRFFFTGLVAIATVFFVPTINIHTDNSLDAWYSENDSHFVAYKKFLDVFGGGRLLIIALRSENIFSMDVLDYIKRKTAEIEEVPYVDRVHSIANANKVIGTADGIEIHPLLAELTPSRLRKIKEYALEDELFRNYLFSLDGKYTSLIVHFSNPPPDESDLAVRKIEEIIGRDRPAHVTVFLSGDRRAMFEFNRYTKQSRTLFPVSIISMICIGIFLLFGSFYIVLLIALIIGMSMIWTLGFYSFLGFSFNVITAMILPLVVILSISDSVHIIKYYNEMKKRFHYQKEVFVATIKYIVKPCFITSITTAFGLLSLSISPISAVQHFGIGAAAGVMFAFIISIILCPVFLTLMPFEQRTSGTIM
jgi:hypothetical protein